MVKRQGDSQLILLMHQSKYHTIDPLILETLNLNERRMNNILDILHGRPIKQYPTTERRTVNRSYVKDKSYTSIDKSEETLPPILLNRKRQKVEPAIEKIEVRTERKINHNRSNDRLTTNQSRSLRKISDRDNKDEPSPEAKHYQKKSERNRRQQKRINTIEAIDWQQQSAKMQEERKKQLMNDYMMSKLKRSKSQEINSKDIYRMDIEDMVAQLTPIEELQQAQKKMQRLKRRAKHLQTFDRNYFSRLNQHDLVVLS